MSKEQFNHAKFARFSVVKCRIFPNKKTFFIRINLDLSEAAVQSLAEGARREIVMARPKPASNKTTTV